MPKPESVLGFSFFGQILSDKDLGKKCEHAFDVYH